MCVEIKNNKYESADDSTYMEYLHDNAFKNKESNIDRIIKRLLRMTSIK